MSVYRIIVLIHVLFATIWVAGHLILALGFLPQALRRKDPSIIEQFESKFEPLGLPAFVIQVLTGLWLGVFYDSQPLGWFAFQGSLATLLAWKVILVLLTIVLVIHARFWIIPKLNPENLKALAWHIIAVTVIGVILLFLGVSIRTGGFF